MNCKGISLLTGLVLLAALSLLAFIAASGTALQRNMAANYQEGSLALKNASVASAYARAWLFSRADIERESACESDCLLPAGFRQAGELPPQPEFESNSWWDEHAIAAGYNPSTAEETPTTDNGAEPARWIIEEIHYETTGDEPGENRAGSIAFYRILSRGTGRNPGSVAVIETIAARPWEGEYLAGAYPPDGLFGTFCKQFENRYDCGVLSWRQRR